MIEKNPDQPLGEELPEPLRTLAQRLTDDEEVDWEAELRKSPQFRAQLESFRIIGSVAVAHRESAATAERPASLFAWGPLQAIEVLGQGGFGVVYRAFDPRLQRDVALKLRRDDAQGGARRWLDEARHLAQVRHPHVVVVHGADIQDGRAGIWLELVRGQSLEARIAAHRLSAREAASIGIELCQAIAAVHAAGLVHGDIKAANVMREDGGRIVLMDFGSAHEPEAGVLVTTTTPLSSAPELLSGGEIGPTADIYSLGVLLYRLVSGRYPVEADSLESLRSSLVSGGITPLRSLRPDLPAEFVAAVERALSLRPEDRWSSAAEFERALASVASRRAPQWWRRPIASVTALLAVALLVAVPMWQRRERTSLVPPQLECTLLRVHQNARTALRDGDRIQPGEHLAIELRANEPLHVYVLNEDEKGEVFVLFPVAGSQLQNPLGAGVVQRLPGSVAGTPFDWVVTSAGGRERFLVVAARTPLETLERQLQSLPPSSPDRPIEYVQLDASTLRALRGVGGMRPSAEPSGTGWGSQLEALAGSMDPTAVPGGLWIRLTTLENPTP